MLASVTTALRSYGDLIACIAVGTAGCLAIIFLRAYRETR